MAEGAENKGFPNGTYGVTMFMEGTFIGAGRLTNEVGLVAVEFARGSYTFGLGGVSVAVETILHGPDVGARELTVVTGA